jgi:general secretion pathway protein D
MRTLGAALSLAVVLSLGSVATAQNGQASHVDIRLKDADLFSATAAVTAQTGIKFIIAETEHKFGSVTMNITNMTPDQAVRYICETAGATWSVDENGVYIIRHKLDVAATQPPPAELPIRVPVRTQKVKLMKADPYHVYSMLVDPLNATAKDSIEILNQKAFDKINTSTAWQPAPLVMIGQGTQNVFHPVAASQGKEPSSVSNNITLPDENANLMGGFGQLQGGGGNLGGGGGNQGGGNQLGGGGGQGGIGDATGLTGGVGFVPQGITRVAYDPTDNSLIVQGTDEAIRELEQLIAQFDVAPRQVVVKMEFITTSTSLDKALGIDWFYQRGSVFAGVRPGTFARAADPVFLNYATGNISTRLRTVLTEGWGRTVTAPLIRTLNNQPAVLQSAVQTTIFINQVTNGPSGIIITPVPVPLPAQTVLAVTPRINGDNTITMFLNPQLQGFGQLKRGPDGSEIPDILTQSISVVARVKNGETIALGGLTNKVDNYSQSRIPILSDLPIIGQLFRGRNTNTNSSELIIFVTPTIVDEDVYGLGP